MAFRVVQAFPWAGVKKIEERKREGSVDTSVADPRANRSSLRWSAESVPGGAAPVSVATGSQHS